MRAVEGTFDALNVDLTVPRDPMSGEVVDRLLSAYAYANELLDAGIDLLARGNSRYMLHVNGLVLWGERDVDVRAREAQLHETERHFYDDASPGGVRALMNYVADHDDENVWLLCAGVYVHMLTEPQLFIEGNHRTAAVIVSQWLVRAGKPPMVLTQHNSKAYFNLSSRLTGCRKRSLRAALDIPKLRRRFARFLEDEGDSRFLSC